MARHPKGSTPKLTDELIEKICQAIRAGLFVDAAVEWAGISKDTYYRWVKAAQTDEATPEVLRLSDSIRRAFAEAEKRDLDVIDRAAQEGSWQAAAWRLERKFPNKWGRQTKVQMEHTGTDGGPIEIQAMTATEVEGRIEKLLQLRANLTDDGAD